MLDAAQAAVDHSAVDQAGVEQAPADQAGADQAGADQAAAAEHVTVGVVIDLPEPHATVIDRWRVRSGNAQPGRIAPHITLLPPTQVAASEMDAVLEHLTKVAALHSTFSLDLRGTGSFRPVSQVAFVQIVQGVQQCVDLEAAILSGPLVRPRDYPYRPHVTIAHDVDDVVLADACAGLSDFVARFRVDHFSLYLRRHGSWANAEEFPLAVDLYDRPEGDAGGAERADDEPTDWRSADPTELG